MKVLVLNHADVERLLVMNECIAVMRDALSRLARGEAYQPLRMIINPPEAAGDMALMPSYQSGGHAAYGLKAVCFFPDNPLRGLDSHQGGVLLFSAETGELMALMSASAITAIRTAAVSGVATDLLARKDCSDLAMIGAGVQARAHLEAMNCVRDIKRVRVASKRFDQSRKFAEEFAPRYPFSIEPVETVEAAIRSADLIVTATTAAEPIVSREWIADGAHLNVVGSSIASTREIDTATMASAALFVDRRESTFNEAGDYLFAMREGAIGRKHVRAEIGELLIGTHAGRSSPDEITLFKSLGLAAEDLASAEYLYRKAKQTGDGVWVEV